MPKQLFFEDVAVGAHISPLVKVVTPRQLVKWAGAAEDFFEIHYDKDFALSQGLSGIVVHGRLKASFLGQLLTDWIGDDGMVRKLACSYRGMDYPQKPITCAGRVTGKHADKTGAYVECEVWTENPEGQKTTTGTATVVLPRRTE